MSDNTDASAAGFKGCQSGTDGSARRARVAVVGAGPAGLYAVQSLLESAQGLGVDVFDRIPTPYGLVRYGIAPDNQKMKSVTRVLRTAFDRGSQVRFIGNVCFGVDIGRTDLLKHYDAVIYATGAQGERWLGIPGEDLPGSYGAKEFVDWYNGHPDASDRDFLLNVHGRAGRNVQAKAERPHAVEFQVRIDLEKVEVGSYLNWTIAKISDRKRDGFAPGIDDDVCFREPVLSWRGFGSGRAASHRVVNADQLLAVQAHRFDHERI